MITNSSNKKILFLSGSDFKEKSIQVIKKTPEIYAKKNWEVHYMVYRDNSIHGNDYYEKEINPNGVHVYRAYWPLTKIRNTNKKYLRFISNKLSSLIVSIGLAIKASLFLAKNKDCEYIYGYGVQGVLSSNIIKLLYPFRKITYISRHQGVFYIKEYLKNKKYSRLLANLDEVFALWLPSDLMIMTNDGTQGDWVLKKIKSRSIKNLLFISNGIEPNKPNKKLARLYIQEKYNIFPADHYLLMASRLVKIKRVDLAIQSVAAYKKKYGMFSYKILVLGDGTEFNNLIDLAKFLEVQDSFIFLGAVPNEDVYQFMVISKSLISLYESSNIGNPFFEAMYSGLPFITVNNGDTSKFVKNLQNGILLNEDDIISELTEVFHKIHLSPTILDSLSTGALKYAEQNIMSWDDRIDTEIATLLGIKKTK